MLIRDQLVYVENVVNTAQLDHTKPRNVKRRSAITNGLISWTASRSWQLRRRRQARKTVATSTTTCRPGVCKVARV